MSQLYELSRPFPPKLVHKAPAGKYGDYVAHSTVTERLLSICGPFDLEVVQTLSDPDGTLTGAIVALTVLVDGRLVTIQEIGDVENPSNHKTNGSRMKDAVSDGIKRCAMRLGCGLHLWSQGNYFLDKQLSKEHQDE